MPFVTHDLAVDREVTGIRTPHVEGRLPDLLPLEDGLQDDARLTDLGKKPLVVERLRANGKRP